MGRKTIILSEETLHKSVYPVLHYMAPGTGKTIVEIIRTVDVFYSRGGHGMGRARRNFLG